MGFALLIKGIFVYIVLVELCRLLVVQVEKDGTALHGRMFPITNQALYLVEVPLGGLESAQSRQSLDAAEPHQHLTADVWVVFIHVRKCQPVELDSRQEIAAKKCF